MKHNEVKMFIPLLIGFLILYSSRNILYLWFEPNNLTGSGNVTNFSKVSYFKGLFPDVNSYIFEFEFGLNFAANNTDVLMASQNSLA